MFLKKDVNRRQFLKRTAGLAVGTIGFPYLITSSALGKTGSVAPSNRVVLGCIGVGDKGIHGLQGFLAKSDVQVVAVCDVKPWRREAARNIINEKYDNKDCAAYNYSYELLARDDIDGVSISSPDHWHVLHALEAARAGKDMYVEKPLAISMDQRHALRDTINRYGRIFQFGTQQRSDIYFQLACEMVLNGQIGKLQTIKVGVLGGIVAPTFPQMPIPDGFDYDRWLGQIPWKPYTENRVVSYYWYHNSDYALGFILGWGVHHIDIAQWGNGTDLSGPVEVEGTAVFPKDGFCDCAVNWDVNIRYANGVTLNFTDSSKNKEGILFNGTDGWIFVNRNFLETYPKSLLQRKLQPLDLRLTAYDDHQRNFLDCIKTRNRTVAPVDVAVRTDTVCHISDIAVRLGRKLNWDPAREKFVNDAQADRMLNRAMRSPWRLS